VGSVHDGCGGARRRPPAADASATDRSADAPAGTPDPRFPSGAGRCGGCVRGRRRSERLGRYRLVAGWHLPRGTYTQLGSGTGSFLVTSAAAGAAGLTEEITLVALAAAVVAQALDRRPRWTVPATLAVLMGLRLLVHLYYQWGSVFVLIWVPGGYLLYRWVGSVWPLVLGHWCYDWLAIAGRAYPDRSRLFEAVLWSVAAAGLVAILVSLARRPATVRVTGAPNWSDRTGSRAVGTAARPHTATRS
jgi:hypothetical protein